MNRSNTRSWLKSLSGRLPLHSQQTLKRLYFTHHIKRGKFVTSEPELERLGEWVKKGDWVIDVGANIGHYTARLSNLVGLGGRVIACEPVPETFALLVALMATTGAHNISLLNVAASADSGVSGMSMPRFVTGLTNYYMASLTTSDSAFDVLTLPLDALTPPERIALIKIDVEGHELKALQGMRTLLTRDHPRLIVEGRSDDVASFLGTCGYRFFELGGSPNRVFEIHNTAQR